MKKILITEDLHALLAEKLRAAGVECHARPGISYDETLRDISNYTGIVVATRIPVDRRLIDAGRNLEFIARAGSGLDRIDVEYAAAKGIKVLSSPEGNANSVAEHAVGLLLALFHNITTSVAETKEGKWLVEQNRVHELEGRTLAIIGYGNTGRAFARKLQPFDMKVLAYDKYLINYGDGNALAAEMDRIFEEAEIVSLHIPLTRETHGMIDTAYLQRFSRSIHLINTSRGKIIRHQDLLGAVRRGKVLSAACDVYENEDFQNLTALEKMTFEQLTETGKVIFTPHIAGKSYEARKKIAEVLWTKILSLG
jgi:D-3-phosphoglycerate dehydrogenase